MANEMLGSITSRCSGKEPALLPRSSSRGGTQTRHERAAEIEPNEMPNRKVQCYTKKEEKTVTLNSMTLKGAQCNIPTAVLRCYHRTKPVQEDLKRTWRTLVTAAPIAVKTARVQRCPQALHTTVQSQRIKT